jgi:hypothetical protein
MTKPNWDCHSEAEQAEFEAYVLDRLYEIEVIIPEQQEDFFLYPDPFLDVIGVIWPREPPKAPSRRKRGRQEGDKRDYSFDEWVWFPDVSQTLALIEWIFKNDWDGKTYRSERNPPTKWDILQTYYGPGLKMNRFKSFQKNWRILARSGNRAKPVKLRYVLKDGRII